MSRRARRSTYAVLATVGILLCSACHNPSPPSPKGLAGPLITAQAISHSHARNAWEVLEYNAHFSFAESANGDPQRLESRRGRSSILLSSSDTPLVYLDGTRLMDVRTLRQITAESIESIRILDGIEGTTFYGTNAGAGVILIRTKAGPK
jgi:outer membrane cobalamin receptor